MRSRQRISLAAYLGVGALIHAAYIGPHFDWQNAWTWGVLLGWPFLIMVWGLGLAVLVAIVVWLLLLPTIIRRHFTWAARMPR